jgi:hypothetical protein
VANELSHDRLRDHITAAMRAKFTQDEPHCWVYEVFDAYFVYEQGGALYRQSYSKTDDAVTLSGDPERVVREINYVSAPGEAVMNRSETVNWIVANCDCWKDKKADLDKLSDGALSVIEAGARAAIANAARPTPPPPPPIVSAPAATPAGPVTSEIAALSATIAALTANVQSLVTSEQQRAEREKAAQEASKDSMVAALVANIADQTQRDAKAALLKGASPEILSMMLAERGLRPAAPGANYSGAAGPLVNSGAKSDAENLLPATTYDFSEFASQRIKEKAAATA